jgi:hypothetical protein
MKVCGKRLKKRIMCIRPKPIRGANMLSFSPAIGYGCICARKSKLQPRGDGPFQILERINDNAYKVDLPGEYGVSATFNVSDLTLFDVGDDSRSNTFEERGDDEDQPNTKRNHANDPLEVPIGPIKRARAKKLKKALNELVQNIWSKMDLEGLGKFKEHE